MKKLALLALFSVSAIVSVYSMDQEPEKEKFGQIRVSIAEASASAALEEQSSPRKLYSCFLFNKHNKELQVQRIMIAQIRGKLSFQILKENQVESVIIVTEHENFSSYNINNSQNTIETADTNTMSDTIAEDNTSANTSLDFSVFLTHDDQQLWARDNWATSFEIIGNFSKLMSELFQSYEKVAVFCPGNSSNVYVLCACVLAEQYIKDKRTALLKGSQDSSQEQAENKLISIDEVLAVIMKQLYHDDAKPLQEAVDYSLSAEEQGFIKFYCSKLLDQPQILRNSRSPKSSRTLTGSSRGKKKD